MNFFSLEFNMKRKREKHQLEFNVLKRMCSMALRLTKSIPDAHSFVRNHKLLAKAFNFNYFTHFFKGCMSICFSSSTVSFFHLRSFPLGQITFFKKAYSKRAQTRTISHLSLSFCKRKYGLLLNFITVNFGNLVKYSVYNCAGLKVDRLALLIISVRQILTEIHCFENKPICSVRHVL